MIFGTLSVLGALDVDDRMLVFTVYGVNCDSGCETRCTLNFIACNYLMNALPSYIWAHNVFLFISYQYKYVLGVSACSWDHGTGDVLEFQNGI
jgi:hypothetical protein